MELKDKLVEFRQKNNMTQAELARKIKTTRQSISKWETGVSYPSLKNINKLCEIFKCSRKELVGNYLYKDDIIIDEQPTIGEKLKSLREKNNLSQEQLAECIDVTRQTIFNYENNITKPDGSKLLELCKLFNISLEYFISSKSEKKVGKVMNRYDWALFSILFLISFISALLDIKIQYSITFLLIIWMSRMAFEAILKKQIKFQKELNYFIFILINLIPNLWEFNGINLIFGTGFVKEFFLFSFVFFTEYILIKNPKRKSFIFGLLPLLSLLILSHNYNILNVNIIIGVMTLLISLFINIYSVIKIITYNLKIRKTIICLIAIFFLISLSYILNLQWTFNYLFNLFLFLFVLLVSVVLAISNKSAKFDILVYIFLFFYNIFPPFSILFSIVIDKGEYIINELNVIEIIVMMIALCVINFRGKNK